MKAALKSKNKTGHQKLSPVKTKSLLVIDNTPIRKKSIKQAQGWLKKIEDTEKSAKKFQEIDLKLYTDWYNLTFNPLIESIDCPVSPFRTAMTQANLTKADRFWWG